MNYYWKSDCPVQWVTQSHPGPSTASVPIHSKHAITRFREEFYQTCHLLGFVNEHLWQHAKHLSLSTHSLIDPVIFTTNWISWMTLLLLAASTFTGFGLYYNPNGIWGTRKSSQDDTAKMKKKRKSKIKMWLSHGITDGSQSRAVLKVHCSITRRQFHQGEIHYYYRDCINSSLSSADWS